MQPKLASESKMKSLLAATFFVTTALAFAPAHADIIDFEGVVIDNLSLAEAPIPNGYAGLNWENVYAILGPALPGTGYENGVVSGEKAAISTYVGPVLIKAPSGTFTFEGGWFTSGRFETGTAYVTGYLDDGDELPDISVDFAITSSAPVFLDVSWSGLKMLTFGALNDDIAVLDDLRISFDRTAPVEAVPEPLTLGLLGTGLLGLAGTRQRRKR